MPANASSGCYVLHQDKIDEWSQSPCGDPKSHVQACCAYGDLCLENSICHFTHLVLNTSGYYTGGCTDPNFKDAACLQQCGNLNQPSITSAER